MTNQSQADYQRAAGQSQTDDAPRTNPFAPIPVSESLKWIVALLLGMAVIVKLIIAFAPIVRAWLGG